MILASREWGDHVVVTGLICQVVKPTHSRGYGLRNTRFAGDTKILTTRTTWKEKEAGREGRKEEGSPHI